MQLARVFIDGFGDYLKYFSKDRDRLVAAFVHMFRTECFFIAVDDGRVVAMAGITNGDDPAVRLNPKPLRRKLGLIRGSIAAMMLNKEWSAGYPIPVGDDWGSIQFVATASDRLRRGGARAVLEHIIRHSEHDTFVLEVGDRNVPAVALYKSLGFTEHARLPDPHSKHSGHNNLLYLRLNRINPVKSDGQLVT